ncbi:MAG: guanylate kinase [Anaerolineae bacterium]|nr:guanylate kinase [Anaerolineae bacterium]
MPIIDEQAHHWGLLFVMVGPAGAGKNAIMNEVLRQLADLRQLPTATTRPIRDTEQQGREHQFVSEAEFQKMDERHELIESQTVHNHLYGTPRLTIENAMRDGQDLIADIEVLGATYLHNAYPHNTVLVFVQPPSVDDLIKRMSIRGETQDEIDRRLQRVEMEMQYAPQCDYLITNYQDQLKQSSATLLGIVLAERSRRSLEKLRLKTTSLQNQAI